MAVCADIPPPYPSYVPGSPNRAKSVHEYSEESLESVERATSEYEKYLQNFFANMTRNNEDKLRTEQRRRWYPLTK